ncbi:hypothetical protein M378DRAFT_166282 [Amanita muscaria Koide BX008]|uniref:Uncharacterized protein n=1 Tax=Amanita muscaria (strain Koide BX008) TaxID=946122 RepID=A0A0C2WK75_AMAMK|nr:hypothetical protein M378DRAFT_166282 [Amanita muscaria Koide BX008]
MIGNAARSSQHLELRKCVDLTWRDWEKSNGKNYQGCVGMSDGLDDLVTMIMDARKLGNVPPLHSE